MCLSHCRTFPTVTTELKQPLSLSKKFDSDNSFLSRCRTFSKDFMDCTNVKLSVVGEGGGGCATSLANFSDSDNIELKQSLSLSNFFDNDNDCFNSIWEQSFWTVLMPNFLAQQQGGTKNTYIHKNRISALLLYLFYIRKVFLEGTSKSSTAFFTVYNLTTPQFSGSRKLVGLK